MSKTRVLLLFGGESTEHDVSVMSARNICEAIDRAEFEVVLGYIDREGRWFLCPEFDEYTHTDRLPQLIPVLGQAMLVAGKEAIKPDVILPVLHGKNGEDGSVQGLAQLLHIPIVGCDMTAGAIGMDKVATKRIAAQLGVAVVPYRVWRAGEPTPTYDTHSAELGETLFVKPTRAGSSVGVSKVRSRDELTAALEAALQVGDNVLIEQALRVRELEVAVLGNPPEHQASRVGEVLPGDDFYSYDDKYAAGSASSVQIPAQAEAAEEIRRQAWRLFAALGCRGLARVDFFLADDGAVYFNEINTFPGFTDASMYPKLWQDSGIEYQQLITRLLKLALA